MKIERLPGMLPPVIGSSHHLLERSPVGLTSFRHLVLPPSPVSFDSATLSPFRTTRGDRWRFSRTHLKPAKTSVSRDSAGQWCDEFIR